jgi:CRISPR type III-A-associated RAMP protein Csm4
LLHSDALYSAVSHAMAQLGSLEAWLDATARAEEPAVRLASCFPYQGDTLLAPPPRHLWPPPASSKVRWKGARFVPVSVVETLAAGRTLAEGAWAIDPDSECLVPARTPALPGPFRVSVRTSAAIDRQGVGAEPYSTACLEFTPGSGLWTLAQFADEAARERWTGPLTAAFRLLADSGLGGERSRGWGRAEQPRITAGEMAQLVFRNPPEPGDAHWLLSLFHPAAGEVIDWQRGSYALTTRGGRVESSAGWGVPKKGTRMVVEGSVLVSAQPPRGLAADVAPDGFAHPVYRAGFAVTLPVPLAPVSKGSA